jgi:hypothetical protein
MSSKSGVSDNPVASLGSASSKLKRRRTFDGRASTGDRTAGA